MTDQARKYLWYDGVTLTVELANGGWSFAGRPAGTFIPIRGAAMVGSDLSLVLEDGSTIVLSDNGHRYRMCRPRPAGEIVAYSTAPQLQQSCREAGGGMVMRQTPVKPVGFFRQEADHEKAVAKWREVEAERTRKQEEARRNAEEWQKQADERRLQQEARHAAKVRSFMERLNAAFVGKTFEVEGVEAHANGSGLTLHLKGGEEIVFEATQPDRDAVSLAVEINGKARFDFDELVDKEL